MSYLYALVFIDRRPGVMTAIVYAPVDTSKLHSPAFFSTPTESKSDKNDYLIFTFQLPTHKELSESKLLLLSLWGGGRRYIWHNQLKIAEKNAKLHSNNGVGVH